MVQKAGSDGCKAKVFALEKREVLRVDVQRYFLKQNAWPLCRAEQSADSGKE